MDARVSEIVHVRRMKVHEASDVATREMLLREMLLRAWYEYHFLVN